MNSNLPDRSHIGTEQPHQIGDLHALGIAGLLAAFADEQQAVEAAYRAALPQLTAFVGEVVPRFAAGGRLIYIGAGTSGRLGVLDASELPPTFQLPAERAVGIIAGGDSALRKSSEGAEDDPHGAEPALRTLALTSNDTVLAIAAGGTTPYACGGLAVAKRLCAGVGTALLSCSPCPQPPGCDRLIVLNTGPELLMGSTRLKAGSVTKLALNAISTTLMVQTGRVYRNLMVDLRASNAKLRDRALRMLLRLGAKDRDDAQRALDAASGQVKVACLMLKLGLDRAAAEARLAAVGGWLHRALGE